MAKSNKSKWIIGLSGAALSAFVITQVNGSGDQNQDVNNQGNISTAGMSNQEKELVKLDWANYSINGVTVTVPEQGGTTRSDRQTRRS